MVLDDRFCYKSILLLVILVDTLETNQNNPILLRNRT